MLRKSFELKICHTGSEDIADSDVPGIVMVVAPILHFLARFSAMFKFILVYNKFFIFASLKSVRKKVVDQSWILSGLFEPSLCLHTLPSL